MKRTRRDAERALVRDALQRAAGFAQPDAARLVERVPAALEQARRRRLAAPTGGLPSLLGERAWPAIPKLAAAAAAAVALAGIMVLAGPDSSPTSVERVILTGGLEEEPGDVLLEAVLEQERG
jgi:hypothetical protein